MKLKIFNLNCWLLPPPISAENNKRIEEIISLVNHTRPDVIMLQEVWLNKYVNKFKNGLQNYSFIATEGKSFNKSGLLTGLKIPYSSHKINFFNHVKGYNVIEKIASKGYHLIHISKDIYLINTHLYAPIKSSNRKITKLQFNLLKKFSKDKKVILAGDLNLEEKDLSQLNNTFNYKSHGI